MSNSLPEKHQRFKGYRCKLCNVPLANIIDMDNFQQHIFLYHPGIEDRYGYCEATRLIKEGKITLTLTVGEYLKFKGDESPL
jgi:hypothetical protein